MMCRTNDVGDKRFLGQMMRRGDDVQAGAYMRIFWGGIKFEIYYPMILVVG